MYPFSDLAAGHLDRPPPRALHPLPWCARRSAAMSSFLLCSSACLARCDRALSLSPSSSGRTVGTSCHDRPYRSLSQPQRSSLPPADSIPHSASISACVSQFTTNEIASENLNCGPPFSAVNCCPLISKDTVMTVFLGPGPAAP